MTHVIKEGNMKRYPVMEIFKSIQGEGVHQGRAATFIRLAGCNLQCPWCDTKDSWEVSCPHEHLRYDSTEEMRASDMHCIKCGKEGSRSELANTVPTTNGKYEWLTTDEILERISAEPGIIVITGGEPSIHDLTILLEILRCHVKDVYIGIETNGTNSLAQYAHLLDWITVAPKPPEFKCFPQADEIKFVVDDKFKIETAEKSAFYPRLNVPIFLQVESGRLESAQRVFDMVMKNPRFRLGTQLHKHLNVR